MFYGAEVGITFVSYSGKRLGGITAALVVDLCGESCRTLLILYCQSTDADYESVPVEAYGLAMLKGMGWNQDEGIGRTFKQLVLFLFIFQNVRLWLSHKAIHVWKTLGQYSIH